MYLGGRLFGVFVYVVDMFYVVVDGGYISFDGSGYFDGFRFLKIVLLVLGVDC